MLIDLEGYRANIGIILLNDLGQVFWAKRIGKTAWQFPQGGMDQGESEEETLFRELYEEVGLKSEDVEILSVTKNWLRYTIPKIIRRPTTPICIGQKQKWFLLRLTSSENKIDFNCSEKAEFDGWCWVSYWYPVRHVVGFKRRVYRKALTILGPQAFAFSKQTDYNLAQSLNLILE